MDELGRLQQQLREEQLKKLKAAEDIAALQAKAPPTNPLLRVRQQTQLDKLKRDEQKAEEECKRLQQLIDNGGIPLSTPAPGKKKKK